MDIRGLIGRVPIEAIVARDFALKGNGRYKRGLEHDSLVVDLQTNRFYWNSAGVSGNALDWLTKVKGLSYRNALEVMQKYSGLPLTNVLEKLEEPVPIYPKLLETFYDLGKSHREYWYKRGINDDTIDHFKLGHTGKAHVIPVINDGVLMNFQCRIGSGPGKKVWAWSRNRPAYPFNVDDNTSDYVIMTEGLTDALAMYQIGLPTLSQSAGNMTWSRDWNKYIIKYNMVYLIYDNDTAGIKGSYRVGKQLLNRAYIMYWPSYFPDKYDVNKLLLHLGEEEAREFIEQVLMSNAIHISDLRALYSRRSFESIDILRDAIDRKARKFINDRHAGLL